MSKLREAFEKGEFAITAEMAPPKEKEPVKTESKKWWQLWK